MPVNREPRIYQGYVISQIGQSAGSEVEMDFKNAQNCVASGTHRWADDPTDMHNGIKAEIAAREANKAAGIEADRLHYEKTLQGAKSIESVLASVAQQVYLAKTEDGTVYLARPWPKTTMVHRSMLEIEGSPATLDGDTLTIELANASAVYDVAAGHETDTLTVTLQSAEMPEVEIPDDWRDRHFLANVATAKKIRGLDNKGKMTKDDAEAILEEWTKHDPVRADQPSEAEIEALKAGEGNRAEPEFQDADGNPVSPEERARQAAKELAEDAEND